MLIGYARVSTEDQKLSLQRDELARAGVQPDRIYEENVSGTTTNRPQLLECIKALREGDTLIVWRLDRLGRSLNDLIKILSDFEERKIGFRSLSESIDTTTAFGRMTFHMMGAIAQFERDLTSERTKAGLKAARKRGHRVGRPPKLKPKQLAQIRKLLEDETTTMEEVAPLFNVSVSTIFRAFAREKKEANAKEFERLKAARKGV